MSMNFVLTLLQNPVKLQDSLSVLNALQRCVYRKIAIPCWVPTDPHPIFLLASKAQFCRLCLRGTKALHIHSDWMRKHLNDAQWEPVQVQMSLWTDFARSPQLPSFLFFSFHFFTQTLSPTFSFLLQFLEAVQYSRASNRMLHEIKRKVRDGHEVTPGRTFYSPSWDLQPSSATRLLGAQTIPSIIQRSFKYVELERSVTKCGTEQNCYATINFHFPLLACYT